MLPRLIIATILSIAIALPPVGACLWDRDTLAMEASGQHDILKVISGRFPRNPPSFYEARLARVEKELAADPKNLALYDDAGVACDRLHRHDAAIGWMEKKATILAEAPDGDHQYRYHANLGTFLIHQWLGAGADPEQPQGKQGADHIRRAIEINPDAHFGREIVQLMAIEWLLEVRSAPADPDNTRYTLLQIDGYPGQPLPGDLDAAEASTGLAGMVALGSAWESVDIFAALAVALSADGRATISHLAKLRAQELLAAGRKSLSPNFPSDASLVAPEMVWAQAPVDRWFTEARSSADRWQEERTRYIEARIKQGEHPDTHPDFWDGFDAAIHPLPPFPKPPPPGSREAIKRVTKVSYWLLVAIALVPVAWFILRSWRNRHGMV